MSATAAGVAPFTGDRAESIEMIRDSARGLLGSDMARVRKLRFTEPGFDAGLLRQMVEIDGQGGGGFHDAADIFAQVFGGAFGGGFEQFFGGGGSRRKGDGKQHQQRRPAHSPPWKWPRLMDIAMGMTVMGATMMMAAVIVLV